MSISYTTTNYSGRKKDLNIFGKVDPYNTDPQRITLGIGKVSSYVAGVQKLVQRYAIMLLTEMETQPVYPTFGTFLVTNLRGSNRTPKDELIHYFNFANLKVLSEMHAYQQTNSDPYDEQISTATLNSMVMAGDSLAFSVTIETKTGESVPFVIPLPL